MDLCGFANCHTRAAPDSDAPLSSMLVSETNYLSLLDERPPCRKWSFHQKALAAAVILFCIAPLVLSALVILLMIITGGPR